MERLDDKELNEAINEFRDITAAQNKEGILNSGQHKVLGWLRELKELREDLDKFNQDGDIIKTFHKRFSEGEQNIFIINEQIFPLEPQYPWQSGELFNIILPEIEPYISRFSEEELYGKNGLVSRLVPLQRAYNAVMNRQLEHIERASIGVYAVEDGSIDMDDIDEDGIAPGKVIVYRNGSQPPQRLALETIDTKPYIESAQYIKSELKSIVTNFLQAHPQRSK